MKSRHISSAVLRTLGLAAMAASAALLTACGGGGSSTPANNPASIGGTSTGTTSKGSTNYVTGSLTLTDPDAGQAVFKTPSSVAGTYGVFTFNASTGAWTYLVDNSKAVTQALSSGQVVYDTLTVTSSDGTATQDIKIAINGTAGGNGTSSLVTNVAPATYSSSDIYAADKVALFNRLNDDRSRCGFGKLAQNEKLDKAAQAHADYLKINNLNVHTEISSLAGFTGETVAKRVAYQGYILNALSPATENISTQEFGNFFIGAPIPYSATEKSATVNLKILYSSVYHLNGLFNQSTEVGFGVNTSQISSNSWQKRLVINFGIPSTANPAGQRIKNEDIVSFPCESTGNLSPIFGPENPDPFPGQDLNQSPYGTPVYFMTASGTTLEITKQSITLNGGQAVNTVILTKENDPQKTTVNAIASNEAFIVPTQRLQDNSTYTVYVEGKNTGSVSATNPTGFFTKTFTFRTSTYTSE